MEKVVPELDLLGLGLGGQKRIFPHTESSNSKAAESGNMDMRKQTIQSGRCLEYMKGISEAPVVLGTYRRTASSNWKSKPTILQSVRGVLLPLRWPYGNTQGGFSSFSLHSRCFMSLCSFP